MYKLKNRNRRHLIIKISPLFAIIIFSLSLMRCQKKAPADESATTNEYYDSPLCSTLYSDPNTLEVFTGQLIDINAVSDVVPFGNTEPYDWQEVLNHELGIYIKNEPAYANVQLLAPADMYINSIEVTNHDNNNDTIVDKTDYGLSYEVCSHIKNNVQEAAVFGNFAHIKSLNADLLSIINEEKTKLQNGSVTPADSPLKCTNGIDGIGTCTFYVSYKRDTDPDYYIKISSGVQFGTTAFPGIDTNLKDKRKNNQTGNYFLNPSRWTLDSGQLMGLKYGVCTYNYFVEPYKSQLLNKVGANGVFRNSVSVTYPCGLLEIDTNADQTAAGTWIVKTKENLYPTENSNMAELENILSGMLALKEDFLTPNTHISMSTNISSLSGHPTTPNLIQFQINFPVGTYTNIPFEQVVPGNIYCYEGVGYLTADNYNFLLELVNLPSPKLKIERLADNAPCNALTQMQRTFSASMMEFVR